MPNLDKNARAREAWRLMTPEQRAWRNLQRKERRARSSESLAVERRRKWVEDSEHREKMLAAARRWRRENKGRADAEIRGRHYKARKNAVPRWLTEEHIEQMRAFYAEAQRLTAATGVKHHVDHIHPLNGRNSCGLHVPWNLQVMPYADNIRKGNSEPVF